MSAVRELVAALVAGGMDAIDAAALVARAGAELTTPQKSANALRQQRFRDRNKALRSVTTLRDDEPLRSVTNRNESVTNNAASLSKKEREDKKEERKRESRALQLPDGWRPSEELWQDAITALGSPLRAEQELTKFKNHALDKGRVSKRWGAAWSNWVGRAIDYAQPRAGPNGQPRATTVYQNNQLEAREIQNAFDQFLGGGSSSSQADTRLLPGNSGERSEGLRSGLGPVVVELSSASSRAGR